MWVRISEIVNKILQESVRKRLFEAENFGNSVYVKSFDLLFKDGKVTGQIDTIGGVIPANFRYDSDSVRYEHIEGKRLIWRKNPRYSDDPERDKEMYRKLLSADYRKRIGEGEVLVVDNGYLEWYNTLYGRFIIRGHFAIKSV